MELAAKAAPALRPARIGGRLKPSERMSEANARHVYLDNAERVGGLGAIEEVARQ